MAQSLNVAQLPDNLKGKLSVDDNFTLTIQCEDNTSANVANFWQLHPHELIERDDGNWLLCHTWTRGWTADDHTNSVFVNLKNGQMHIGPSLFLWRAHLTFGCNGKLLLIDAGIQASSARQILLVDVSDLNALNVVYREEIWFDPPSDYECRFDEQSQSLVMKYRYVFYQNGNVVSATAPTLPPSLGDESEEIALLRAGVRIVPTEVTIARKIDANRVSAPRAEKWITQGTVLSLPVTDYGTNCSVDETSTQIISSSPNHSEFAKFIPLLATGTTATAI